MPPSVDSKSKSKKINSKRSSKVVNSSQESEPPPARTGAKAPPPKPAPRGPPPPGPPLKVSMYDDLYGDTRDNTRGSPSIVSVLSMPDLDPPSPPPGVPSSSSVAGDMLSVSPTLAHESATVALAGAQRRIKQMQSELEACFDEIHLLRRDREALKVAVEELQDIIDTRNERAFGMGHASRGSLEGVEEEPGDTTEVVSRALTDQRKKHDSEKRAIYGELAKANKEKEKALKLLICVIGKERVGKVLLNHAGKTDILEVLISTFGNMSMDSNGIKTRVKS